MHKQSKAYLYAALTVLFWSTVGSAFKISLRFLDVLPLLFLASVVSTIVFFTNLLLQRKLNLLRTLPPKEYLYSAFLGLLNPFLYYLVLLKAYSILPAQEALVLNFTWPITLVLLSMPLLKQRIRPKSILAIIISFLGVFVIATRGSVTTFEFTNPAGVSLAVGSSLIWALFWIYNVKDTLDAAMRLFLNFLFGSCFIFLSMPLFSEITLPTFNGLLGGAYIGVFEMGITFLVWLRALKLSETTAYVANLIYLVPFLSVIVIHFAVGEQIFLSTLTGLGLIVAGIILQKL
jgi:drug/metabolite transporter (DMT)-like permease